MPGATILDIELAGFLGEATDRLWTATGEPIGVGQDDEGLRVIWQTLGDRFKQRNDHFRDLAVRPRNIDQLLGSRLTREGAKAVEKGAQIVMLAVVLDDPAQSIGGVQRGV